MAPKNPEPKKLYPNLPTEAIPNEDCGNGV